MNNFQKRRDLNQLKQGTKIFIMISDPSFQKNFSDLKSNYVQNDLIEEPWVTVKILTVEPIEITESANAEKKDL